MSLGWFYEPCGFTGGANAGAFRNALAGAGIRLPELLAREVVQNSVDAVADAAKPVEVRFRTITHDGASLSALRSALSIGEPHSPAVRHGLLSPAPGEAEFGDALSQPLRSLVIEDFNTTGLAGTHRPIPLEPDDNYYRLCMELGGTKDFEHERGGTYGYGKSVAWVASRLWTVILYSRFAPSERSEGASARTLVVSWFREHVHEQRRYTGRAWFGVVCKEKGEIYAGALVDEDAHRFAQRVGFTHRGTESPGLSLMILGCDVSLPLLKEGVERSWWPRLLDGKLAVELENGEHARPRENDALQRYVRCWDLLHERQPVADTELVSAESYKGKKLGRVALTTLLDPDRIKPADVERARLAMIRGPGMVVHYHEGPFIQQGHPQVEGAFLADEGIDEVLAKSEPPAHNLWDADTTRTDRPLSDSERGLISKLYDKVNSKTRGFLNDQREPPPKPPDRCKQLELLLGQYLRTKKGKPVIEPTPSPFSIRFIEQPRHVIEDGHAYIDARLALRLSDNAEDREYFCRVGCWLETVVERGRVGSSLPMSYMALRDSTGDTQLGTEEARLSLANCLLEGAEEIAIDLRSAALPHPEYRAKLVIRVTEET